MEECREAYATWIELAQEVLKQKNLEESELAKKAIGYEDMLKGRKLMMAKTDGEEKPKMKGLNCSKSYKISCASATPGRSKKKLLDRRWKMKVRVLSSKWSSFRYSHPSKSVKRRRTVFMIVRTEPCS